MHYMTVRLTMPTCAAAAAAAIVLPPAVVGREQWRAQPIGCSDEVQATARQLHVHMQQWILILPPLLPESSPVLCLSCLCLAVFLARHPPRQSPSFSRLLPHANDLLPRSASP
jgi:hypothetical protein